MTLIPYIKDVGRGAAGARALSREQAADAMGQLLDGSVDPVAAGAFLMAMRVKGETLPEIEGFLDAAHQRCLTVAADRPVVVLPSANGARRLPNLTPLLALLLAREGWPVLVHGPLLDPGRVTSASILAVLGIPPAQNGEQVQRAWARGEPAFMSTATLCPGLQALLDLRQRMGLRGPGHTVSKMLAPVSGAPALRVIHHTHPEFGTLMASWVQSQGADALLLRGTEGEPVADPRRQPRMEAYLEGRAAPLLSAPAHEGVLTALPLLPSTCDAASTAVYIQEVLSGSRPTPAPVALQVRLLAQLASAMAQRPAVSQAHQLAALAPARPAAAQAAASST